jgi:hypothetical protein
MVADAREDLTAFTAFPPAHWRKLWSTNPLERLSITTTPSFPPPHGTRPHGLQVQCRHYDSHVKQQ